MGDIGGARAALDESTRSDAGSAQAWYWLGRTYVVSGPGMSWSKAIDAFQRALALDATIREAHWGLGIARFGLVEYEEADREFAAFLAQPGDQAPPEMRGEAEHFRGVIARQGGDLDRALACFERAAKLHPRFAETPYERGLTLEAAGRNPDAAAAFEAAIELDRNHMPSHFRLSRLYRELGRAADALREEKLHRALNGLFDNTTGRDQRDPARRIELWGTIAGLDAKNVRARFEYARALVEQKRESEAAVSLDDLIGSAPQLVEAYVLAVELALRRNDRDKAATLLGKLRANVPGLAPSSLPPNLRALLESR